MAAAVIVEPRRHPLLPAVLKNVHERLPKSWDLYIFHGPANAAYVQTATAPLKGRRIFQKGLEKENLTAGDYNELMTSESFWNQVDAEHILVFQTDTVLCGKGPLDMSSFLKYPYIGCSYDTKHVGERVPWPGKAFYGVGGLSLRKKSFMLDCIRSTPRSAGKGEDVFFSECVAKRADRVKDAATLGAFCTEYYLNQPKFVGVHKTHHDFKGNKGQLFQICPEARLLESLRPPQSRAAPASERARHAQHGGSSRTRQRQSRRARRGGSRRRRM